MYLWCQLVDGPKKSKHRKQISAHVALKLFVIYLMIVAKRMPFFSFLNLFKPSPVFSSKETKIPTSLFSQQKQRRNKESDASMLCWFSQFPSRVQQIVQTGFEHECISFCSLLYKCNPACRVQGFTLSPMMGFGFKALPCLQ